MNLLFLISSIAYTVFAHSHLECTNVQPDGKCLGFPRHYQHYKSGYENTDESKDRNFVAPPGSFQCPLTPVGVSEQYTTQYPMAEMNKGSNMTLQWPPRGHQNQPSSDVEIFCAKQPSSSSLSVFSPQLMGSEVELVAKFPYATNCRGSDISWAKCFGSFKVPEEWPEGKRTCFWVWELSGARYVDCFELDVRGGPTANETQVSDTQFETTTTAEISMEDIQVGTVSNEEEICYDDASALIDTVSTTSEDVQDEFKETPFGTVDLRRENTSESQDNTAERWKKLRRALSNLLPKC